MSVPSDVPIFPEAFSLWAFHSEVKGLLNDRFSPSDTWKIITKNVSSDHGVVIDHRVVNTNLDLKMEAKHKVVPNFVFNVEYLGKPCMLKPAVTYDINGTKEHIISFSPYDEEALTYMWKHPEGVFSTKVSSQLYRDIGNVKVAGNCRVTEDVLAGISLEYNGIKSGLKNYVLSTKYLNKCALSYDASGSVAVSAIQHIGKSLKAVIEASWQRTAVGASLLCIGSFPLGGIAGKVDIATGNAAVCVHTALGLNRWVGAVTVNGNAYKMMYSGIGLSFTMEE